MGKSFKGQIDGQNSQGQVGTAVDAMFIEHKEFVAAIREPKAIIEDVKVTYRTRAMPAACTIPLFEVLD